MRAQPRLLRQPGWRRGLAIVVGLTAVVAMSGGCADDDGDGSASESVPAAVRASERQEVTADDMGPFALRDVDVAGPETALGGGLTVPEGAILLGVPFPDLVGGGYRALLLVPGDPLEVFNAFGEQAGGMGMVGEESCLGQETNMGCRGHYVDPADGESLTVSVARRVSEKGVVSGAGLRYRPPGSDPIEDPGSGEGATPTQPVSEVALPTAVEPPPEGDVAVAVRGPGTPARPLERGSRLVGVPGPCACDGQGWSFVVQITGMMRDVLSAYGRQYVDLGAAPDISDRRRDDLTLLGLRISGPTGVAEIRAVEADNGRDYAIVTVQGA